MNSSALTDFAPLDTERSEALDLNDLMDGDLGIGAGFEFVFRSPDSPFCFFVGESLLLKVNVRLRGRSRLVELADLSSCASSCASSTADPCRDLDDFCGACFVFSPMEDWAEFVREVWGMSSLCMRTKSALTSSFSVRI